MKNSVISSRRSPNISSRKKWLFIVATVFISLAILEVGSRLIEMAQRSLTEEINPYVDPSNPVNVFELKSVDGKKMYRRSSDHPLVVAGQQFRAAKTDDTFRVFMLGGSAAAGWPHREYSITSLLARKLRKLLPDRKIEVFNVAGGTYASHRVRFVFDEMIEYDPDLILIYSGNNEFLENFVFPSRSLPSPWRHSALVRILHLGFRGLLQESPPRPTFDVKNYSLADQVSNRLSYAFGKASKYRQDPEQFRHIQQHYHYNIESMVKGCKRRNIPVMLLNVPVNLKDWIPNVSVHRGDLSPAELQQWQLHFREGYVALERDEFEKAVMSLEKATRIDDEHLARAKQQLGQVEEAKKEYVKTLVRDAYPFRALPEFQTIISEIAKSHDIPLIDIVALLEMRAEDGIMGLDCLLDYVHLTARSQEAVAHEILKTIHGAQLLPTPLAGRIEDTRIAVPDEFEDTLTNHEQLFLAYGKLFSQALVMRQYDQLEHIHSRYIRLIRRIAQERPERVRDCRSTLNLLEIIMSVIKPYRKLLRAEKLGIVEEQFSAEEATGIFANYVELTRRIEAKEMSLEKFNRFVPESRYDSDKGDDSS